MIDTYNILMWSHQTSVMSCHVNSFCATTTQISFSVMKQNQKVFIKYRECKHTQKYSFVCYDIESFDNLSLLPHTDIVQYNPHDNLHTEPGEQRSDLWLGWKQEDKSFGGSFPANAGACRGSSSERSKTINVNGANIYNNAL